jgi:hypothetical protein
MSELPEAEPRMTRIKKRKDISEIRVIRGRKKSVSSVKSVVKMLL